MISLRQANQRSAEIQSAYSNASADFKILGNQDETWLHERLVVKPGCDHVPYTVELAKVVGKVYADLGRALASNQQSLALIGTMLEDEAKRIDRGETAAEAKQRADERTTWWETQRAERVQAWKEADSRYRSGTKKRKP